MPLSSDTLNSLRKKLEHDRERIVRELEEFAQKNPTMKDDWDTTFPQYGTHTSEQDENADETEEYANLLPVEHALEQRIQDIDSALEKMRTQRYGICEQCTKEIDVKRLTVNPEARLCLSCRLAADGR
ncbi:MAG: TraR/DksA C4-type zinc finger protein [Parcubacteria group bacterium]|nr:TraR/DksA C4-type zinc finger protein [Parcubacteria group bacterium]